MSREDISMAGEHQADVESGSQAASLLSPRQKGDGISRQDEIIRESEDSASS